MNCIFCGSEKFISLGTEWDTDLGQLNEIWKCEGCQRTHATPADDNPFQDVPDGTYDPKPSEYGASDLP